MRSQHRGHGRHQPRVSQFDLFRTQDPGPQWRHLPLSTRSAVTTLMVRLLNEHRRPERPGAVGERRDD